MKCVFCIDVTRIGDVVFENGETWVVLHNDWSVRGHAMIVHRRHIENVSDLSADEWSRFSTIWHHAERVLLELTGCERAIILKLGILTPHLHVHIFPVRETATREEVFAAIDGTTRVERDDEFVRSVRESLTAAFG